MKITRVANIAAAFVLMASSISYADTYDSVANLLTIPTITIGATTYTDVVVTVGSVVSVGGSSTPATPAAADRSCSGSMVGSNIMGFTFALTIHPSAGTISVSLTGTTNTSSFSPIYYSFIQGNNSVTGTYNPYMSGVFWSGVAGFNTGTVPTGVTKSGTFSGFPSWFNFNQPFVMNNDITGDQLTC